MKTKQKIVVLGYMASGKSTVGNALAKRLDCSFIDLDTYIVNKMKKTISDIFKENGEKYFRKLELKYLRKVLKKEKSFVLSLGGGTPSIKGAMKMINKRSLSVYLNASVETLSKRLLPSTTRERPLLESIDSDAIKEFIKLQLATRMVSYEKAEWEIMVDDLSTETIVNEILEKLK